ncbi:MAG TPA: hypothetical protein PLC42_03115 [Parachlamydiaceae bacterium]|nr:hypothetical protein [Parachlamydiaceae bacterium]
MKWQQEGLLLKNMIKKLLLLLLFPFFISATELKPWYGDYLVGESRSKVLFQQFRKVATSKGKTSYKANDFFLSQSFAFSYDRYAAEVELVAAATRAQNFNLDHLKLTGRYQILDDIVEDPVSMVVGFSLIEAGRPALHDLSSFHHGLLELELHAAIGKEISYGEFWLKRYFALFAIGFGQGSPWLRAECSYAQNYCELHQFEVFLASLFGLGGKSLRVASFHGYGSIRHQSVDVGLKYSYLLENVGGVLSLDYSYRIYAMNFPKNANRLCLTFFYPFGLGI